MSASFSRSIRALQNDSATRSIWRILWVGGLLLLWFGWFFGAEVPTVVVSQTAVIQSNSRILATFPPDALITLQPNQPAQLQLDDFPQSQYGTVPATVSRVDAAVREGQIQVDLRILPRQNSPIPLQRDLSGTVEIEVGSRSPAELLWQAVGQKVSRLNAQPSSTDEGGR